MPTESSQNNLNNTPENNPVLDQNFLDSIKPYAREVSYPAGDIIVSRGDPGSFLYLILSGSVEVFLSEQQRRLPLARLTAGAPFGEMSLLTGSPVSAHVAAVTPTTLLQIPAEKFQKAIAHSAPLRNHILSTLCHNLRHTSAEAWNLYQHSQTLSSLINVSEKDEPIIAESPAMTRLQQQLDDIPADSTPLLITGEPGVGKCFLAKKIHHKFAQPTNPVIFVDCRLINPEQSGKILFGAQNLHNLTWTNLPQDPSQLRLEGAIHLADHGSLILKHLDVLDPDAQKTLSKYLESQSQTDNLFPRTRIIATTSQELNTIASKEQFLFDLNQQQKTNIIMVPPLRRRKRDILPLAQLSLKNSPSSDHAKTLTFTESAQHALLAGKYHHRNVAELREAVELAATFADSDLIDAQHIFTGPKHTDNPIEHDLTHKPFFRWLTKKNSTRLLQAIMLAIFSTIIFFCLTTPESNLGQIANALAWGAWWPTMLVIFLLFGRLWCTVCPVATAGRIARSFGAIKSAPPPDWIKNNTGWIMALLFILIIWSEHVFHMTETPYATGILLIILMTLPVFFCLFFQRETWCRYICPLGSLAAGYAACSTIQVHANPAICASQCTSHDCYKGADKEPGCPMFHHPLYSRDAHFCKLCFTCLRSCPHQSPRIFIRPPLMDLWRLDDLSKTLVPFALIVFFLSIILLLATRINNIAVPTTFSALTALSLILTYLFNGAFNRCISTDHDPALIARISFALLILAWGPFMAFHLTSIPQLETIHFLTNNDSTLGNFLQNHTLNLLFLSQFLAITFAALISAISLRRIRSNRQNLKDSYNPWLWRSILTVSIIYFVVAIYLILP